MDNAITKLGAVAAKEPTLDDAKAAMAEYDRGYLAGGEPIFPHWAYLMLKASGAKAPNEGAALQELSAQLTDIQVEQRVVL